MTKCLLCLELNRKLIDRIIVNSVLWRSENMKYLIEKHFWKLETIKPSSWICTTCWQELYNFHKFYMHIEEAHSKLDPLFEYVQNVDNTNVDDCKKEFVAETSIISPTDDANVIVEPDVLNITKESHKDLRKSPIKDEIEEFQIVCHDSDVESECREKDLQKCTKKDDVNSSEQLCHNSDRDSELEVEKESQKSSIKNYQDSSQQLCNDSDTDSEHRQNETTSESTKLSREKKLTRKEKDVFIAANFQLTCDLCHISIENFSDLKTHFREVHNMNGYVKCCERKIITSVLLVDHINVHLNPDYFKCEHCGKVLKARAIYDGHMRTHKDVKHKFPYSCDICSSHYKELSKFESHKLNRCISKKDLSCSKCGKKCETKKKLMVHERTHFEKKFLKICELCGKTFIDRGTFNTHMKIHQNKRPDPVKCDICDHYLVDNRAMRAHKKRQHPEDGIKEYPCPKCPQVSNNHRSLQIHIRQAHVVGYDHKCTMCDKVFKRKVGLREHMATHTREPLYTCQWCPQTFISSGNIHKHRKTAHLKEWREYQSQKYKTPQNTKTV